MRPSKAVAAAHLRVACTRLLRRTFFSWYAVVLSTGAMAKVLPGLMELAPDAQILRLPSSPFRRRVQRPRSASCVLCPSSRSHGAHRG